MKRTELIRLLNEVQEESEKVTDVAHFAIRFIANANTTALLEVIKQIENMRDDIYYAFNYSTPENTVQYLNKLNNFLTAITKEFFMIPWNNIIKLYERELGPVNCIAFN